MQIITRTLPRPVPRPVSHPVAPVPARSLWADLDCRLSANGVQALRTALVGFAGGDLGQILDLFAAIGTDRAVAVADVRSLLDGDANWDGFDAILVSHDGFDCVAAAVDAYLAFRPRFPGKAVILVSRLVAQDDLGSERAAICDATLRFPFTAARLRQGLQAALLNRKVAPQRPGA